MQDTTEALAYVRISIYLVLFSFSILSMRALFKKIRLFGLGLCVLTGSLLFSSAYTYFAGEAARVTNGVILTIATVAWMLLWLYTLGYYDDGRDR